MGYAVHPWEPLVVRAQGSRRAVVQGWKVRPELDPAFLPQIVGQLGEAMAVRSSLSFRGRGKLHGKVDGIRD